MPDLHQKPRFIEGKDVIRACRSARWSSWSLELLDEAHKAGCKLRKTGDHHVMITNDLGGTTTLAGRNSSNGARSRKEAAAVIDAQNEHRIREAMNDPKLPEPRPVPTPPPRRFNPEPEPDLPGFPAEEDVEVTAEPSCPLCDPELFFPDEDELEEHRKANHWQCPQCGDWVKNARGAGGHVSLHHRTGPPPWEYRKDYKGGPAAGTVSELIDDVRRGTVATGKKARELFEPKVNPNGTRKGGPTKTVPLPEPEKVPELVDAEKLARIQAVLGEDPRVAALTAERDEWKRRAEDAETKIEMMRAHARQLTEAADL